jgi:hypothetical protein
MVVSSRDDRAKRATKLRGLLSSLDGGMLERPAMAVFGIWRLGNVGETMYLEITCQ